MIFDIKFIYYIAAKFSLLSHTIYISQFVILNDPHRHHQQQHQQL